MRVQIIEKNDKPEWAIIPYAEYRKLLKAVEDAYWVIQSQLADKQGYLGQKKSEKLLRDLLNAD